jgi:predicted dehydrogenase
MRLGALGVGAAAIATAGAGCASSRGAAAMQPYRAESRRIGAAPIQPLATPPMEIVRVGFVGVGGMGTVHVTNFADIPGVRIDAICDIREAHVARAQKIVTDAGMPKPRGYSRGERDFERMVAEEDLDLVLTATPWKWHVPVCVAAMKAGKHAATEVPAAYTLDDCWELVETAEEFGRHCVMMENCNYDRAELMALNMIRKGLLGEVLHAECGYLHDLRSIKFSDNGEGLWRRDHSWSRNGNLYPTHGLGPVAQYMDINRGDQFAHLVSMSGPSRGLQLYAEENFPAGSSQRGETFVLGDVNVSLIRTVGGRTIYLSHDTNLPRPYSRINLVQGTKGIFQGYPNRVYIEGVSDPHRWDDWTEHFEEHDHPLWKFELANEHDAGHGGMDYLESYRLVKCLREGKQTDMNVYDAAALSAVCELTEISVANGSQPVEFPDFTRGRWKEWERLALYEA